MGEMIQNIYSSVESEEAAKKLYDAASDPASFIKALDNI